MSIDFCLFGLFGHREFLNCPLHFGSAYTFIAFIHNSGSYEVHQASVKEGEGASE
jgi:hypothetical protein